ncbi:MAG: 16S rRNA (guanine(527)-N(7))-methyltransferase RsmG [Clostridia bacterium]|nr:16S rRNA (guanine(527)-N(7))-methyltransferase RsmG [Clostridia bacterium]
MLEAILTGGANKIGVSLSQDAVSAFRIYHEFLQDKNSVMNLTAISGEEDVARLHFLDCLALMPMFDFKGKRIIDVGSGAGFPGMPLRLADPSVSLTLLDAQQKRIAFLTELCEKTGSIDVKCLHARAEEAALLPEMRESFDYAVSRAVARLRVLAELCLPFVRTGGAFLAMKSTGADEETSESEQAIAILGGVLENEIDYPVPGTNVIHRVVVIRKITNTPKGYPRRFAKIQKSPL